MAKRTPKHNEKKEKWRQKKREEKARASVMDGFDKRHWTDADVDRIKRATSDLSPVEQEEFIRRATIHRDELVAHIAAVDAYKKRLDACRSKEDLEALGPEPVAPPNWDPFVLAEEVRRGITIECETPENVRALLSSDELIAPLNERERAIFRAKRPAFEKELLEKGPPYTLNCEHFLNRVRFEARQTDDEVLQEFLASDPEAAQLYLGLGADRREALRRHASKLRDMIRSGVPTEQIMQEVVRLVGPRVRPPDYRQYKQQKYNRAEDQSVESCLEFTAACLSASRKSVGEDRAEPLQYYTWLREARVFHIGHEIYEALVTESDRFVRAAAGLEPSTEYNVTPEEEREYTRVITHEGKCRVWPEKFPFPIVFLGYDRGVNIHDAAFARFAERENIASARVVGHLVTAAGNAVTCTAGELLSEERFLNVDECRVPSGWVRGLLLEPLVIPHLIQLINEHRTFVIEQDVSRAVRRSIKENRKALGIDDYKRMPKPFYTLKLQSQVVQERVRKMLGRPRAPACYRTDVRAHERCRIRRGVLPIDPKLAAKLEKRGYKIFTTNQLDQETYQRLSERGLAHKRADEWLAVKASWVKDHMSSTDEKLPYIPAVRKMGAVRIKQKKATGAWTEDPSAR